MRRKFFTVVFVFIFLTFFASAVSANHSWGDYHWARTDNPFTLKLGDNLSSNWDSYLATTSTDWNFSSVLDTAIVSGRTNPKNCRPSSGRVEVCNNRYGSNGWLGLAQIWISGSHITQGVTKVNDTYFRMSKYNTSSWKNLVMCQEVGHTLGLDHQDENFDNVNLGSCMDYTSNPSGPPNNEHPNLHDFEQLETIYQHFDSFTTLSATSRKLPFGQLIAESVKNAVLENRSDWGKELRNNGHVALFERDFGKGNRVYTFVIWTQE